MDEPWTEDNIRAVFLTHGWSPEGAQFFAERRGELRAQKIIARMFGVKFRFPSPSDQTKREIPRALRWQIWERDNFTCQDCGIRQNLTIDHILPENAGGTLDRENLQTLCESCNSRKGYSLKD